MNNLVLQFLETENTNINSIEQDSHYQEFLKTAAEHPDWLKNTVELYKKIKSTKKYSLKDWPRYLDTENTEIVAIYLEENPKIIYSYCGDWQDPVNITYVLNKKTKLGFEISDMFSHEHQTGVSYIFNYLKSLADEK